MAGLAGWLVWSVGLRTRHAGHLRRRQGAGQKMANSWSAAAGVAEETVASPRHPSIHQRSDSRSSRAVVKGWRQLQMSDRKRLSEVEGEPGLFGAVFEDF